MPRVRSLFTNHIQMPLQHNDRSPSIFRACGYSNHQIACAIALTVQLTLLRPLLEPLAQPRLVLRAARKSVDPFKMFQYSGSGIDHPFLLKSRGCTPIRQLSKIIGIKSYSCSIVEPGRLLTMHTYRLLGTRSLSSMALISHAAKIEGTRVDVNAINLQAPRHWNRCPLWSQAD